MKPSPKPSAIEDIKYFLEKYERCGDVSHMKKALLLTDAEICRVSCAKNRKQVK